MSNGNLKEGLRWVEQAEADIKTARGLLKLAQGIQIFIPRELLINITIKK